MKNRLIEEIYDSVQGELIFPIPGVENAIAEGSTCERLYQEVLDAYERLCMRLGTKEEDEDVEIIINSLLEIQKELCEKMYMYGAEFGIRY